MKGFWDKLNTTGKLVVLSGIILVGLLGFSVIDIITSPPTAEESAVYCRLLTEEISMLEKDATDFGTAAERADLQYRFYQERLARYHNYPAGPEINALQMNHPMANTSSEFIVAQNKLRSLLALDQAIWQRQCAAGEKK